MDLVEYLNNKLKEQQSNNSKNKYSHIIHRSYLLSTLPFRKPSSPSSPSSPSLSSFSSSQSLNTTSTGIMGIAHRVFHQLTSSSTSLSSSPSSSSSVFPRYPFTATSPLLSAFTGEGGRGRGGGSPFTTMIIGINGIVFLMWKSPKYEPFLYQNALMTTYNLRVGRYHNLLTSCFSHRSLTHIAFNMIALWSFGSQLERDIGSGKYLTLFLTSGFVGGVCSALKGKYAGNQASLGASGGVYGVMVAYTMLYPDARLSLIFLPFYSFTAMSALKVAITVDMLGSIHNFLQAKGINIIKFTSRLGHEAHLGGALTGFLFFHFFLSKRFSTPYLPSRSGAPSATRDYPSDRSHALPPPPSPPSYPSYPSSPYPNTNSPSLPPPSPPSHLPDPSSFPSLAEIKKNLK